MRILTRDENTSEWRPWPDALRWLESLPDAWDGMALLVSDAPEDELPRLVATARLVRRLCERATVIAGSRHPANTWMAALRAAGVDRFWRLDGGWNGAGRRPGAHVEVLTGPVCPALHTRTEEGTTVSACGMGGDRLVLPQRQLERFCLHDHTACPYWTADSGTAELRPAESGMTEQGRRCSDH